MSHILIQDPSNISSRFSTEDRLGYDGEESEIDSIIERDLSPAPEDSFEYLISESLHFGSIEKFLHRIPEREADLISLYHRDRMKQEQIAHMFGITQAAVSYRLHRGIRRIQFLRTIPELDKETFDLELGPRFADQDREILWLMYETTCQSAIAKMLGLTQGRVRHRFFRSLDKIKDLIIDEAKECYVTLKMERKRGSLITDEEIKKEVEKVVNRSKYAKYWTVYYAISDKHFNILHEVKLPQFSDRGDAQILAGC